MPLSGEKGEGRYAIVDEEDAHLGEGRKWHLCRDYVEHSELGGNKVYLHRLVMGAEVGEVVLFGSANKLDCRKSNLRRATHFCKNGHDKRVVGITFNRRCAVCEGEYQVERRRGVQEANPRSVARAVLVPNIREVREELGVKRSVLSRACDLDESCVRRLEEGVRKATPATVEKLVSGVARLRREAS